MRIRKYIAEEVLEKSREHAERFLKYLFAVLLGAVAAILWNLNGEIYKAVGETHVSEKAYEIEIDRLKDEIKDLKKLITNKDCLENKKVIDKARCYE